MWKGKETANEFFEINELVLPEDIRDKQSYNSIFKKAGIYSYCWNIMNVPLLLILASLFIGVAIKLSINFESK